MPQLSGKKEHAKYTHKNYSRHGGMFNSGVRNYLTKPVAVFDFPGAFRRKIARKKVVNGDSRLDCTGYHANEERFFARDQL